MVIDREKEIMVRVTNWRCIEDVELELAKLNIFIGKNSTGKSSLAYAIYLASKSRTADPRSLVSQLYGCDFNFVARLVESNPQFPISVKINDSEFLVKGAEETIRLPNSPWTDEFLLPSRRIAYIQLATTLPWVIKETNEAVPLPPSLSLFILDYTRALIGKMHITSASDGVADLSIFFSMTQGVPEKSLVVIEELEIHKNPISIIEFTKDIVEVTKNKKITTIMTTHSDVPLTTMAKLVKDKKLSADDVRIYYFKRDPWTKLSSIKLFDDGTLESLPDTEEVITRLF